MEKTLSYVAHAEECQILALGAPTDECKIEYLKLATAWTDLADERRIFLFGPARTKPH